MTPPYTDCKHLKGNDQGRVVYKIHLFHLKRKMHTILKENEKKSFCSLFFLVFVDKNNLFFWWKIHRNFKKETEQEQKELKIISSTESVS